MLQIEITFDFCFQEHFWDEQPDVKSNHAIVITIIHHDWIEEIQQFCWAVKLTNYFRIRQTFLGHANGSSTKLLSI